MRISDWSSDVCSSDLAVQGSEVTNSYRPLGESFADVGFYVAAIPTYQGGLMAMGWAIDDPPKRRHDASTIEPRFPPLGLAPRFYTPPIHQPSSPLPTLYFHLLNFLLLLRTSYVSFVCT